MSSTPQCKHARRHSETLPDAESPQPVWLRSWCLTWTLISGAFALVWLILRSGPRPNRMAYPCQQAALSTAILAFGAPVVSTVVTARRGLAAGLRRPAGIAVAAIGLTLAAGTWAYLSRANEPGQAMLPSVDYVAEVFHVSECPQDSIGARFVGVDNLITLMGREGTRFYESASESLTAGPDGIIAADDTVVIKINYQWDQRGGTNVDVLRGLIQRVVDHPDTFAGEIVVCENSQFNSINNFDRPLNNAQDYSLSPHDVVVEYQNLGYTISHYDWTVRRFTSVGEYSEGNMTDGYIVHDYDALLHGRVSYPKFRTSYGTYVSLRYGLWDTSSETYDRDHLKFVNIPVLKSHSATYGATACVKHYMGTVTRELSTNSHSAIRWGVLGALLGEIQLADLNLLDCIWINANPHDGPWTTYNGATRRDELVASVDPVALDIWAVKNILIPAFIANGYSPPWPYPSADPDNPNSSFRLYLDQSMDEILAAGYEVTNDLDQIHTESWNGAGDSDGDSDVDLMDFADAIDCLTDPGTPAGAGCDVFDFDGDSDVDMHDYAEFQLAFTGPGLH